MQKQVNLTIVIPAYNEEKRIGTTLDEVAKFLKNDHFFKPKKVEVLVVAADATDRTHEIIAAKQSLFDDCRMLVPGPRAGKGRDVQYGMLRARGQLILFMDADLATPLKHIESFYKTLEQGADIVVGTRNLRAYRSNQLRNGFSYLGNRAYQILSGQHIEDTQCGFKMFTHSAAQLCFSRLTIMGWYFDLEIIAIARANDLLLEQERINDWENKPHSTHTDGAITITFRMVRDFAKILRNQMRGIY